MIFGALRNKLGAKFDTFKNMVEFQKLGLKYKKYVFYSENENYFGYLKGPLIDLLKDEDCCVTFVSSSKNDPGLQLSHRNLRKYYIGTGFIRDYFFKTLHCENLITTTPDLEISRLKRSQHTKRYIYVQHSLVSLHMVYRQNAFDYFDVLFCAGPHHVLEARALEAFNKSPPKQLIETGYSKFDDLLQQKNKILNQKTQEIGKTVLIAPSWDLNGLIETNKCGGVIEECLDAGFAVILRPHPQTTRKYKANIQKLLEKYSNERRFSYDLDLTKTDSYVHADVLISDWSGAALEYSLALKKPVIFCDLPRKVNNKNYKMLNITPVEERLREKLGVVWNIEAESFRHAFDRLSLKNIHMRSKLSEEYVFNHAKSSSKIVEYLKCLS